MKLLLVNLPRLDLVAPSAALGILNGIAKDCGCDTTIVDFVHICKTNMTDDEYAKLNDWCMNIINDLPKDIENKLISLWCDNVYNVATDYDYLCVSIFSYWSLNPAKTLLSIKSPIPVIAGGNGCNNAKDWIGEYANHVCYGDAENFMRKLLVGKEYGENLDDFPFPSYEGFDLSKYTSDKVYMTGSRGCVRRCTFCDIQNIWPQFRYRSGKNIVEEMKHHINTIGISYFDFTDSLINGSVSNFYNMNVAISESNLNVKYAGQAICRPRNQMPSHHYEAMYYAGCDQLTIGIESFSEDVRNHMRKKFSNADIDYHIQQSGFYGIKNIWLMITGYPTETLYDHQQNLGGLERYKDYAQSVIELMRWGTTMHINMDTPIHSMLQYTKLDSYDWIYNKLDLKERIRRRLELHTKTYECGYAQPRVREELNIIKEISRRLQ